MERPWKLMWQQKTSMKQKMAIEFGVANIMREIEQQWKVWEKKSLKWHLVMLDGLNCKCVGRWR